MSRRSSSRWGAWSSSPARTLRSAIRAPYPYGEELVEQIVFAIRLCWLPLLASTFALDLGAPGLQAAGPLHVFGSLDRLGGFFVLTAIRWIGPIVTAIVVAGVLATAITADLGAREHPRGARRLQAPGVRDPGRTWSAPALPRASCLRDGALRRLLGDRSPRRRNPRRADRPPEPRRLLRQLFLNASITDVWGSVLMCSIFGAIIAVVLAVTRG